MSIEKEKNLVVYMEIAEKTPINASLEILTQARNIANNTGDKIVAVLFETDELERLGKICIDYGADEVICIKEKRLENEIIARNLLRLKKEYEPRIIFLAATSEGKNIGAMLASYLKHPALMDVVGLHMSNGKEIFTISMYNGNILKEVSILNQKTALVILRSGLCKKEILEGRNGNIQTRVPIEIEAKVKILETVKEISESVNLEEAEIIISGGRGMGSKENFELVKKLAEILGGVVGATRPVIEENWISRSHQIGQSGKIVAPKLYIACGISGATQHISGAIGSNYIVAINKDEDAPIFEVSDLGIVGNAMELLPAMIEKIKKVKTSN